MENTNTTKQTSGYDFASAIGGNYSSYNCGACMYRLPCGYCKELGRQCPYSPITTTTYTYGATLDNASSVVQQVTT